VYAKKEKVLRKEVGKRSRENGKEGIEMCPKCKK